MTEISTREKEKWTNKGTDKQEMADSFLHYQMLVPNFIILCRAVPEKCLTEISYSVYRSDRW